DIRKDRRPARIPRLPEKIDVLCDEAEMLQRPGYDRELRVEQPPKRNRGQHGGHDEWNEDQRAENGLKGHPFIQQKSKIEPNRELYDAGNDSIEKRVRHRQPENGVVP